MEPKSRKERERQARREEILDAARLVFAERGFEKAKLDEIAEIAEYGKGTIYNYFRSKEELFVQVIVRGIKRYQDYVSTAAALQSDAVQKLSAYIDASFTFFENNKQLFGVFEFERSTLARSLDSDVLQTFCEKQLGVIQYLEQLCFEGIKAGRLRDMAPGQMAEMLFGLIHVSTINALRTPGKRNLQRDATLIKELFFHGVLTDN